MGQTRASGRPQIIVGFLSRQGRDRNHNLKLIFLVLYPIINTKGSFTKITLEIAICFIGTSDTDAGD